MSTIQVRIDEKVKQSATKVFDKMGIDMSTGVKIFLTQVVLRRKMPFEMLTENGLTEKQERAILRAEKEALAGKNVVGPFEGREAIEYLKSLR